MAIPVILYAKGVTEQHAYDIPDHMPGPLPTAVEKQVDQAVKVRTSIPRLNPNGSVTKKDEAANTFALSGVSIGGGYILSAGHGLTSDSAPATEKQTSCASVEIHGYSSKGKPYEKQAIGNVAVNQGFGNDFALYKMSNNNHTPLPAAPNIRKTPLTVGEKVFFINWEPTENDDQRDPSDNTGIGHNKPAVFAGVVIEAGDAPRVVTDIESYGTGLPDKNSRPGASGGMLVDANGDFAGLSNGGIDESLRNSTIGIIWRILNKRIGTLGLPGDGEYVSTITPVTDTKVDQLKHELDKKIAHSPTC